MRYLDLTGIYPGTRLENWFELGLSKWVRNARDDMPRGILIAKVLIRTYGPLRFDLHAGTSRPEGIYYSATPYKTMLNALQHIRGPFETSPVPIVCVRRPRRCAT